MNEWLGEPVPLFQHPGKGILRNFINNLVINIFKISALRLQCNSGKTKNSWCYSYFTLIQIMNSTRSFLFSQNFIEVSMHWFQKLFITWLLMKFLRMPLPESWITVTSSPNHSFIQLLEGLVVGKTQFRFSNFLEKIQFRFSNFLEKIHLHLMKDLKKKKKDSILENGVEGENIWWTL